MAFKLQEKYVNTNVRYICRLQCLLHCLWLKFAHKSIWNSLQLKTRPSTTCVRFVHPISPSCNNNKLQFGDQKKLWPITESSCSVGIRSGLICWFNSRHFHNNLLPQTVIPAIYDSVPLLQERCSIISESELNPPGHWGCWLYVLMITHLDNKSVLRLV